MVSGNEVTWLGEVIGNISDSRNTEDLPDYTGSLNSAGRGW